MSFDELYKGQVYKVGEFRFFLAHNFFGLDSNYMGSYLRGTLVAWLKFIMCY